MKLIKTKDLYLPLNWPVEIKPNGVLSYFIYGKGYQKAKKFEIVEGIELPERWDNISWLDIAKMYDQYGIEVANVYAECKTAGIISRQFARGYGLTYSIIKDILPQNFDPAFFECLKADYMLSCFGMYLFSITDTDEAFAKIDKEYNPEHCAYKGKFNVSMHKYVELKYGPEYCKIIDRLIAKIE